MNMNLILVLILPAVSSSGPATGGNLPPKALFEKTRNEIDQLLQQSGKFSAQSTSGREVSYSIFGDPGDNKENLQRFSQIREEKERLETQLQECTDLETRLKTSLESGSIDRAEVENASQQREKAEEELREFLDTSGSS